MKDTTPEIRQNVRISILRVLKAAGPMGFAHPNIHTGLAANGIGDWTADELKAELKLMQSMDLVAQEKNKFLGELGRWTLAEDGRVALAEIGL